MNLSEIIIMSPTESQLGLLQYLATVVHFLFIPFLGIVICGTILSLWLKRKGEKEDNRIFTLMAKEVISQATFSKGAAIAMGVIPLAGLIIIFSQLLNSMPLPTVTYLATAFILFIIGLIFVYTYRYSLTFTTAAEGIEGEMKSLRESAVSLSQKSGAWGIAFLIIASYFYIAGITQATYPNHRDGMTFASGFLVSGLVIFKWIYFLLISFSLAGGYLLFMNFFWEGGNKSLAEESRKYLSELSLRLVYFTTVSLPLFILINLYTLPDGVMTFGLFALSFIALFLILAVLSIIFMVFKGTGLKKSGWVFVLVLFVSYLLIIAENSVIFIASKTHLILQAVK
ncbi:MAG: hypothetical protein AB9882_03955 [Ignavibacteriaceae bacterium]